jgi:hypothetical protein
MIRIPRNGPKTEKAFRAWLAALARYLALPRRAQIAKHFKYWCVLANMAEKTADPYRYLLRVSRAVTMDGAHRKPRKPPKKAQLKGHSHGVGRNK